MMIYTGNVIHKRLRPRPHALRYRVFSMLVDLDALPELDRSFRLFSVNRRNVFSFHERDHGPGETSGLAAHVRQLLDEGGVRVDAEGRILLLSYPRMLGYVFNPISVYYCLDRSGGAQAIVYEVNNTWGERHSYVVPVTGSDDGLHAQSSVKRMHVSPFASPHGIYHFQVTEPGVRVTVGVRLSDQDGALIKTHFTGEGEAASDRRLLSLLWRFPLMTWKVMAGIHWEALKLWLKGIPVTRGDSTPRYTYSIAETQNGKVPDAA